MFIKRGRIEHTIFEQTKKKTATKADDVISEGGKHVDKWGETFEDIWASLYKMRPELKEPKEGVAGTEVLSEMFGEMINSQSFKEIKPKTVLKPNMSLISSILLSENFISSLPEKVKKYEEERKKLQERMKDLKKKLKNENRQMTDEEKEALRQQYKTLKQLKKEMGGMEEVKQEMRLDLKEKLKETSENIDGLSCLGGGEQSLLDENEAFELFELMKGNKSIAELLRMVGRMKNLLASSKFKKLKATADETYEVKVGKSIVDALPSERMLLAHPKTRILFLSKYVQESLLVYKKKKNKKQGRGPIICCIDESASTSNNNVIEWEKALGITLSKIAEKEKRDIFWISFSSPGQTKTRFIKKGAYSFSELKEFITHFFNGNTCFNSAFKACFEAIGQSSKADIVFITDGACGMSDEDVRKIKTFAKERDVKILSICVNGRTTILEEFSDSVYDLAFEGEEIVLQDVFSQITL